MTGYTFVVDDDAPHLGGNIAEGDPRTFAPSVWQYMINRFALRSVLDLGSGLGYSAAYFARRGVVTIAADGLPSNVDTAVYPTVYADLTRAPIVCNVDLVHCQEVVEHIEEKYLDNLLVSLGSGRFILMSHGTPGQPGHHHVNLQDSAYWVTHIRKHGFTLLTEDTERVKTIAAKEGAVHLARSGLVFART